MNRILASTAVLALVSASTVFAAEKELKSGLQVGDRAGAYNVKDCTGPSKGTSLCYR